MFNDNQINTLKQELNISRIKTREKGNINLSYLEGFDIIETANSIFGFGYWDYTISKLEQVSQEKNQNDNTVICYKAVVQVLVHNIDYSKDVSREDVGFGTGVSKSLADAHEGAAKEAITDALKRAMRSFGNQFGNSLYDKSRNHNTTIPSGNNQQYQNNSKTQSFNQYEYQSLYNLGLNIIEQNGYLIVTGDDIYNKKDSIKACGFRFDNKSKCWYKPIELAA